MKSVLIWMAVLATLLMASTAAAQTTEFTYQGQLTDSGAAQPTYQMRFRLFDAPASGNQLGDAIENAAVAVDGGVFTVALDFGAPVFSGADRYLEIGVRRNGGESYTVLSPRQQITSSPYSIRTLSAQTADLALDSEKLGGLDADEYLTNASAGSAFVRNDTVEQTGNFNISGTGIIGSALGVGTEIPISMLTVARGLHIDLDDVNGIILESALTFGGNKQVGIGSRRTAGPNQYGLDFYTGGTRRVYISPIGRLGIATNTPAQLLHVAGTGAIAGNLGVGNVDPQQRLHVSGNAYITGNVGIGVASPAYSMHTDFGYFTSRLGVGTAPTNATFALDVLGSTRLQGNTRVTGNTITEGNVLVQNNRGIVRSNSATQYKIVPFNLSNVSVNLAPGASFTTGNISYGESFSSAPRVFVGQMTNASGTAGNVAWLRIIPIFSGTSSTQFYVVNLGPSTLTLSTISFACLAIGPQ
jgi:hypothetical protein